MRRSRVGFLVALALAAAACSPAAPDAPVGADGQADPVLVTGQEVYQSGCVQCHGGTGSGGRGPRLNDGVVAEKYPDIADQIAIITNGKGGMPSFSERLTQDEIEAVARYTREVLNNEN